MKLAKVEDRWRATQSVQGGGLGMDGWGEQTQNFHSGHLGLFPAWTWSPDECFACEDVQNGTLTHLHFTYVRVSGGPESFPSY